VGSPRPRGRPRPVGQDGQLHGLDLQGRRRRLQNHHRPRGPAQQPALADPDSPRRGLPRLRDLRQGRHRQAHRRRRDRQRHRDQPNCATNRSNNGDFNTKVAKHYAISPEQRPWLFVVKKNKTVLERLLKWIRNHVADAKDADGRQALVSNLPLLLIDDEADHASVDTGEQLHSTRTARPTTSTSPRPSTAASGKSSTRSPKRPTSDTRPPRSRTSSSTAAGRRPRRGPTCSRNPSSSTWPPRRTTSAPPASSACDPGRTLGGLPWSREVDDHVDSTGKEGWMPPSTRRPRPSVHAGERRGSSVPARGRRLLRPGLRGADAAGAGAPALLHAGPRHALQLRAGGGAQAGRGPRQADEAEDFERGFEPTSFSTSGARSGSPTSSPPRRALAKALPGSSQPARCRPGTTSWQVLPESSRDIDVA
jgi:hypothetical protein